MSQVFLRLDRNLNKMTSLNSKFVEDDDESSFFSADEGDEEDGSRKLAVFAEKSPTGHIDPAVTKSVDEPSPEIQPISSNRRENVDFKNSAEILKKCLREQLVEWSSDNWASTTFDEPPASKEAEVFGEKVEIKLKSGSDHGDPSPEPLGRSTKPKRSKAPNSKGRPHEKQLLEDVGAQQPQNSWFGGWNTLISAASDSINNITSTVGEGLTTVLETMESGLGAPSPEELARMSLEEKRELSKKADEVKEPLPVNVADDCDSAEEVLSEGASDKATGRSDGDDLSSGYQSDGVLLGASHSPPMPSASLSSGLLSNVSQLIGTTSRNLVTGSLDVMENIGKRTFDVLTEPVTSFSSQNYSNPALPPHQRRKLRFQAEKPDLSAVLREAKSKNARSAAKKFTCSDCDSSDTVENLKPSFDGFFEKHNGTVSLEAMQILAQSQQVKFESILNSLSRERKIVLLKNLDQSKENFVEILTAENLRTIDAMEFESEFLETWDVIDICAFKCNRLLDVHGKFFKQVEMHSVTTDAQNVFVQCVEFFGEFAACAVEMFVKLCQLLMVEKQCPNYGNFAKLAKLILVEIEKAASITSNVLKSCPVNDEFENNAASIVADLFLEAHNTSTCLQDASYLMLPIFNILFVECRIQ